MRVAAMTKRSQYKRTFTFDVTKNSAKDGGVAKIGVDKSAGDAKLKIPVIGGLGIALEKWIRIGLEFGDFADIEEVAGV
jgi:hypothetical protein